MIDPRSPVSQDMRASDLVKSIVGLLILCKNNIKTVAPFREGPVFKVAPCMSNVPNRVRQWGDTGGGELREHTGELSLRMPESTKAPFTALYG